MIDQFENTAVPFTNEAAQNIKNIIRQQLSRVQGSTENLEGFNRAKYILAANKLTGLELKRLKHYIEQMPKDAEGRISDPAYALIGGDALATFVQEEMLRLRHQINKSAENQEELGKTEKQDVKPPKPADTEAVTGLPRLGNEFGKAITEEVTKIKHLIVY